MSYTKVINFYLQNNPLQKLINAADHSKLISSFQPIHLSIDEVLYTPKFVAEQIYYLAQGHVTLQTPSKEMITLNEGEYFGEESLLSLPHYVSKATAQSPCEILQIPVQEFKKIFNEDQKVRDKIFFLYSQKFIHSSLSTPKIPLETPSVNKKILPQEVCWALSLIIPLFIYILLKNAPFDHSFTLYFTTLSACICLWIFSLIPPFATAFLMITAMTILELAPIPTILSGFSHDTFLILLSMISLGKAFASSHILQRLMLMILKFLPPTHFWMNSSLFILGIVSTIVIPFATFRQKLFQSFTKNLIQQLSLPLSQGTALKMMLSTYSGIRSFSPVFLTGSLYNLLVFSLLMPYQNHLSWYEWFLNAFPYCMFFPLFFALGLIIFFKETDKLISFRERVEVQLHILGKSDFKEWGLYILSSLYLLMLITQSYHGLSGLSLAMILFSIVIAFELITIEDLLNRINITSLILLASLLGSIATFHYLEISDKISFSLPLIEMVIKKNFEIFALSFGFCLTIVRLVIPYGLTIAVTAVILIPFAQHQGINPWLIGFLILIFSQDSLLPTSASSLNYFIKEYQQDPQGNRDYLIKYHLMITLVKLIAVYFSIPFWKDMSLI